MPIEDILESLKSDVEEAKQARQDAQELIDMAHEADIDVSEQEAELSELSRKIDRLETAIKERTE